MITDTQIKIIESATDIMMSDFITVLVDGNFDLLKIEGDPSPADLRRAWDKIYSEYMAALGDNSHTELLSALRDINILNLQYKRITTLIQVLSVYYVPEAVEELRKLGYRVKYDKSNMKRYFKDLHSAYERSKTLLIKISIRQKDLENLNKGKKANRADFQTMLISLSEYAKYQVNADKISAYQFAVMMNRCNSYAKNLEKSINKGGKTWRKN